MTAMGVGWQVALGHSWVAYTAGLQLPMTLPELALTGLRLPLTSWPPRRGPFKPSTPPCTGRMCGSSCHMPFPCH